MSTPFCPACGERSPSARDLTFAGLLDQLVRALVDVDGRLIRSVRYLVTRPGELTVAYREGRRLPYLGPIQLFLVANVLFFAMQSLTGTNVVPSTLDSHLHRQDWGSVAQDLVARRLAAQQTTLERYAPVFDRTIVLYAKSLIIVMVVPFAALLPIVFRRSRQPFGIHVVFALHVYAFLLLLFCAALAVSAIDVAAGGGGLADAAIDHALSLVNLAACATYLYLATGRVYGARGVVRVVTAVALALAAAAILLGYRFVLLLITLLAT